VLLRGGNLSNTDLVGATVVARVWNDTTPAAVLVASVLDPVRKTIRVNLGGPGGWLPTLSIDVETEFSLEYEVTFVDGREWTWPTDEPDRIVVRPQGG
jgi:hypothetical protein